MPFSLAFIASLKYVQYLFFKARHWSKKMEIAKHFSSKKNFHT